MKFLIVAACAALALAGCGNQSDNYGPEYMQPGTASLDLNYIALRDCKTPAETGTQAAIRETRRDCVTARAAQHR